ncbi:ABC transporter ATP-binding protein [Thalassomonas viridans]|uniref:ABC transporter ATP-binding protein n=1 Tax=Thalassomonas viridans TaxID=137584 RepID=A0AAE9ZAK8_9GAMM|nr:ABC transporter ATP-binding protein [Thalassomonas viridans]WDE09039.1 ABC transporter ATP-binding protein [Thalassomonas viridans]
MNKNNQTKIIEVSHLRKNFAGYQAVRDISFTVNQGEILALLGPNGAGKTTTINCMLGFLKPDGGEVHIDGINPAKDVVRARQQLAYIPEQVALYPKLSGLENLVYMSKIAGVDKSREQFQQLLEKVNLPGHAIHKAIAGYSKGMKQKVGIAIALAKNARALILDEPTSGLDPSASHEFSQLIRSLAGEGVAILMATHDLYRAQEDAHSVAIMNQGRLVHNISGDTIQSVQLESLYLEHVRVASTC